MSIDASRTVSGRTETPEEGIRLSIYAEMRTSGADPSGFLDILAYAVQNAIWTKLRDKDGNPLTFRQFIEAPYPVGVGSSVEAVAKLVKLPHRYEHGNPTKAAELTQLREEVARQLNDPANPQGRPNKGNNITFSPVEDNERGTSREYTVRRLKRDRPDLAEMVIGGELSANAAAIEAGFRRRDTPVDTLRRAWGKASAAERAAFLHEIGAQ